MMVDRSNDILVKKNKTLSQAIRRGLYLGTASLATAGGMAVSGQAVAQDQDSASLVDEAQLLEEVIVTGSRLSRSGFDSGTPMDVVNVQEAISLGYSDLNEMLIATPALAGSNQVTDVLSGINGANGGEGVQTADLRGLGAGRTLSLLNGRRAGPAGIRDGVASFDINVIPISGLERIEVLKDGASSIYGSDAIGGVINYITRKGDGGEVNAYVQSAEEGGGETYAINASFGKESERGYWRVTADYNKQEVLLKGDREIFDCREQYFFWEEGLRTRADMIDPRTDSYKCMGGTVGTLYVYDYSEYTYYAYDDDGWTSNAGLKRIVYDWDGGIRDSGALPDRNNGANDPADLRVPEGFYILPSGVEGQRLRGTFGQYDDLVTMVPERERMTIMATGELNVSDEVTLYAEALFNRRETNHEYLGQTWGYNYTSDWSQGNTEACGSWSDCWDYDYYSYYYVPNGYGDPLSEGWTGAYSLSPAAPYMEGSVKTKVDYTRVVLGAMGEIGQSDWDFDVSFQYSNSAGKYSDGVLMQDSWYASANMMPLWGGDHIGPCEGTTFDRYGPDGEIREANIECVTVNFLDPETIQGNFTDAQRNFLFTDETGTTDYTNMSLDVGFTNNELFTWYAGDIGLAVGAQFMSDEINDTPGIETLSCNVWNGISGLCGYSTIGETGTMAAYAETAIPLLAGKKGFDYLELNASVRWTQVSIDDTEDSDARDYDDTTYKVGLNWKINDNFRFRANTGTSFRTPALFELYRKNFHTWPGQRNNDPCHMWGEGLENGDITERMASNCSAEGIPDDINSLLAMDVITGGGAAVLDPETATSTTVGMVYTANNVGFRMSLDYWALEVEDQIGIFSHKGILNGCYDSDTYPNDALCKLITREGANEGTEAFRVLTVQSSYINLDVQRTAGWDFEANYVTSFANAWNLTINGSATYVTVKESESVEGDVTSRLGRAGNPDLVGFLTFRLDKGPWTASWRMNYVGSTNDNREGLSKTGTRTGLDGETETYWYDRKLASRLYHNASVGYWFGKNRDWQATLNVANLTDSKPPRASSEAGISIQGYGAFYSQYDWKGRRWGLNIKKVF